MHVHKPKTKQESTNNHFSLTSLCIVLIMLTNNPKNSDSSQKV